MKRIHTLLNIIIGSFIGVLIGRSFFLYLDYINNPQIYAAQSAPWYTSILLNAGITLFVVIVCLAVKLFLWKKSGQRQN